MFVKQPHQFYGESVIYSYLLESVISRFPIIVIDENTYAAIKNYPKTDLLVKKDKNDSIVNQKALVKEFLKVHPDIQIYDEKVDDGYTGVNFVEVR